MNARAIEVRIVDTSIGIWQDDANDPTFRDEVYLGLQKILKRQRWKVRADPRTRERYPILSPNHRLATRGDLMAEVQLHGRKVDIELWAETWPLDNCNGQRYDFGKRQRLRYLDRVRVDLLTRHIITWLEGIATVTVHDTNLRHRLTAAERIAENYAKSWHTDKALGRPVCRYDCDSRSQDGGVVEHGATVWFTDPKGRVLRGVAHYNINNMWWVVTDKFGLTNVSSGQIFTRPPADLRTKRNDRQRRKRLEGELGSAVRRMDFLRADLVKRVLFGADPSYAIWSRKNDAYYRAGYEGYTSDAIAAGRYTWDEACREVLRVPHHLSLVMPDGSHLQAVDLETRRAA